MGLRVAVVGLGGIGNRHATIYHEHPKCEVVAVCDIIKERADAAAAKYDAKAFYSLDEMLSSGLRIDAASMCTAGVENGGDHYLPTMQLLGARIPTLGEKPISNELDKAKEMVALAKKNKVRYAIDLNHRFTPAALMAKEWVDAGKLGELNIINMTMWINNRNESSPWFHMRALHPHSFDVMCYFGGDIAKVQAFFKKGAGRKIWSNVQVNVQFKNGIVGHLTGSYDATGPGGSYGLERLEVVGQEARFVLEDACEHLTFFPRFSHELVTYDYVGGMMSFGETFKSRIDKWIQQNLDNVKPEDVDASGEDGLKVQTYIEACIESWQTGAVVTID